MKKVTRPCCGSETNDRHETWCNLYKVPDEAKPEATLGKAMTDEELKRVAKRAEAMVVNAPAVEEALLGCIAYFFNQIYDGAPDGGGVPAPFQDAIEAYAKAHGVGQGPRDQRIAIDYVMMEAARYAEEMGI
jgi:hypothetical protein